MNYATIVLQLFIAITLVGIANGFLNLNSIDVYGQSVSNETSAGNSSMGTQIIVNIREISSSTAEKMVALVNTDDDVQARKVNLDKAIMQPGQENSYSPSKMVDVTIPMNKVIKPNTEIMACAIQLGSSSYYQSVKCNTVFSQRGSAEPQKIIVPLS